MSIAFIDQTNRHIDMLVSLCWSSLGSVSGATLATPPIGVLTQDTDDTEEDAAEPDDTEEPRAAPSLLAYPFTPPRRIFSDFVIAVDSGVKHLGSLVGGGVAFAIRGAAACSFGDQFLILRYNTGALLITPTNKISVFRYIGQRLGSPDMYVEEKDGKLIPRPSAVDTVNQIQDRCRSFVERMIQEEALGLLAANKGGILLIDGALVKSYDTPGIYLRAMLDTARNNNTDICAVSKRSRIVIGNTPVDSLFDAYPTFVGYAPLLDAIRKERESYEQSGVRAVEDLTEGTEIFAARFGFGLPGLTFRVDVSKSMGSTDSEIINDVYNKCQIYGGYPKPLIDAHQYSVIFGSDAIALLSDVAVRSGLRVKEEPSMDVLFRPFGSFGK